MKVQVKVNKLHYIMVDALFNIKNKYYKKMYTECGLHLKHSARESHLH